MLDIAVQRRRLKQERQKKAKHTEKQNKRQQPKEEDASKADPEDKCTRTPNPKSSHPFKQSFLVHKSRIEAIEKKREQKEDAKYRRRRAKFPNGDWPRDWRAPVPLRHYHGGNARHYTTSDSDEVYKTTVRPKRPTAAEMRQAAQEAWRKKEEARVKEEERQKAEMVRLIQESEKRQVRDWRWDFWDFEEGLDMENLGSRGW